MRYFPRLAIIAALGLLGCRSATSSDAGPQVLATTTNNRPWQLRLHLDSSPPSRAPRTRAIDGIVAPDFSSYRLDFEPILGHSLAAGIHLQVIKGRELPIEINLGELSSDHEIVTLRGRMARSDSIVGTWEEILYCCGARGRFTLWRPRD